MHTLNEKVLANTSTPGGKLVFRFFGALVEFGRDIICEHTSAGLQAARARGRKGGRPCSATDAAKRKKIEVEKVLHADPTNSIEDICDTLHISHSTLYRWVEMVK
jgi:DNA invertase Pin-like site-specific DNA recombinase